MNCEIKLYLSRTKNWVISEISKTFRAANGSPVQEVVTATIGSLFEINNVKLYVSIVTLLINDKIKLLENKEQGFKRTCF